jgi:hypothetical protein
MAVALPAKRGGAATAVEGDIRRLVEQAALPPEAMTILDALNPAVAVEPLIAATTRILATVRRNEPGSQARSRA